MSALDLLRTDWHDLPDGDAELRVAWVALRSAVGTVVAIALALAGAA